MNPALRERIEAACLKGRSSIHATGSSPGFITEALPIVLTSLARRLDLLLIDEFANCTDGCSEEMLLNIMGFGETAEVFSRRRHADRVCDARPGILTTADLPQVITRLG